jgi:GAF domain-containing protein
MSPRNRKYKRIEALFSKSPPVAPDYPPQAAAMTPATGISDERHAHPSVEDSRPVSVVPPAAASPATDGQDFENGIDRGQKLGFAYDQGKVTSLEKASLPPLENPLCLPLMVSGATIGIVQGTANEAGWTAQEIEIVGAVTAQLAQHLENLRRLDQNEKHTHE